MTYIINGKRFNCVLDAMEYRDILDAHYINVVWKQCSKQTRYDNDWD